MAPPRGRRRNCVDARAAATRGSTCRCSPSIGVPFFPSMLPGILVAGIAQCSSMLNAQSPEPRAQSPEHKCPRSSSSLPSFLIPPLLLRSFWLTEALFSGFRADLDQHSFRAHPREPPSGTGTGTGTRTLLARLPSALSLSWPWKLPFATRAEPATSRSCLIKSQTIHSFSRPHARPYPSLIPRSLDPSVPLKLGPCLSYPTHTQHTQTHTHTLTHYIHTLSLSLPPLSFLFAPTPARIYDLGWRQAQTLTCLDPRLPGLYPSLPLPGPFHSQPPVDPPAMQAAAPNCPP